MDLLLVFVLFIGSLIACLSAGVTMLLPLAVGVVLFAAVALHRGYSPKEVWSMMLSGEKNALIVIRIMLLLGALTGLWRSSGTIAYFVTLGLRAIPPSLFVLAAFLLSSAMSFALGTSFGVAATCGAILMTICRAGGADPVITAGAIFSGIYVGDRGSPAASSGNLVAVLTGTDMRDNVRRMLSMSLVPYLACCAVYLLLSFRSPIESIDTALLAEIAAEFRLQWLCLLPALLMLVLPFCRVSISLSIAASILASFCLTLFVQGLPLGDALRSLLLGYTPARPALAGIFSGGGVSSMLEVVGILILSGTYGGLFRGAKLLEQADRVLLSLRGRIGRFETMFLLGTAICAVFCNQTIGSIMQSELSSPLYGDTPEERSAKMLDIENTTILLAGLIPWCLASSAPLRMMGAESAALPFGCYLYLVPLWAWIRSRRRT